MAHTYRQLIQEDSKGHLVPVTLRDDYYTWGPKRARVMKLMARQHLRTQDKKAIRFELSLMADDIAATLIEREAEAAEDAEVEAAYALQEMWDYYDSDYDSSPPWGEGWNHDEETI